MLYKLIAIGAYAAILLGIAFVSLRRKQTASDYMIGGRSMNFWLTALAAHASDMSSWFLLGLPGMIFVHGLSQAWIGLSLLAFMFLNWHFVAPRIRKLTEECGTLTFSSFFEARFGDTTGTTRLLSAGMLLLYYAIYISAGLIGLGVLIESFFGIDYTLAVTLSLCVVVPYLFLGGYTTLAWVDLFQGTFLLAVILFVPFYVLGGDFAGLKAAAGPKMTFFADPKGALYLFASWGLGYFGQPHIVTKFMGIRKVSEMRKAKRVGMAWQALALAAVFLIAFVGLYLFPEGLADPERVFVEMVRGAFHPLFAGFILCAVFAATISTVDSQILVLASTLAEDLYKKVFNKEASEEHVLLASRLFVFLIALIAFAVAIVRPGTIFGLVAYAWSGLGATFGPLILFACFAKRRRKEGAWAGLVIGGTLAAIWPLFGTEIPTILPAFVVSCGAIWALSRRRVRETPHLTHE